MYLTARLMRITASLSASRLGSVRLPDAGRLWAFEAKAEDRELPGRVNSR